MLMELLRELIVEVFRALFLEELCRRVKVTLGGRARRQRLRRHQTLLRQLRVRQRDRLIHTLTTSDEGNL
jgi:hypothetical protein